MSEYRFDPFQNRWVIISEERSRRPSDFSQTEKKQCPFCRGNESLAPPEIAAVRKNPGSFTDWTVRVVPNKFPAVRLRTSSVTESSPAGIPYIRNKGEGFHEVIIETPVHEVNLDELPSSHIADILRIYGERIKKLSRAPGIKFILVFKNHGRSAGASLSHAHSQLIATRVIPEQIKGQLHSMKNYQRENDRCLLCDIVKKEIKQEKRLIFQEKGLAAFCPFASRFPYEIIITSEKHHAEFFSLSSAEYELLAGFLKTILKKIRRNLNNPDYNYVLHTLPYLKNGLENPEKEYHWYLDLFPRLSSPAGFEWGSGLHINTVSPESAASRIRGT